MPEHEFAPAASPELQASMLLLRVGFEALAATMPRKKGERFLRVIAERLAEEENLSRVFPIRPSSHRAGQSEARQQAAEMYERWLPIFLAALPPE